jgi:hypothetical protein
LKVGPIPCIIRCLFNTIVFSTIPHNMIQYKVLSDFAIHHNKLYNNNSTYLNSSCAGKMNPKDLLLEGLAFYTPFDRVRPPQKLHSIYC